MIGEAKFRNQLGLIGKSRKNNSTYIRFDRFWSTFRLKNSIL